MVGNKKKGKAKKRLDSFYDLAKRQGYRARSAFKLIQLNRKYDFLKNCSSVIDLCAAPGGWMQVAQQYMPVGSTIIGVDLAPIKGLPGCKCILGDIYSDRTRKDVENALKGGKAEVVLHDGSPNVGGVWHQEVFAQHQLVLQALKISTQHLAPDGWFITKVFRSENFNSLLWVLKQLFTKVEATKPIASRTESSEIYVICQGYKSPHRVDPKFFKVNEVFSETAEQKAENSAAIFQLSTSATQTQDVTRNLHNRCRVIDLVRSSDPQKLLGGVNEITFDRSDDFDKKCYESTFTTKEILYICADIKQASEADLKRLLRWKERFRADLPERQQKTPKEVQKEAPKKAEENEEDLETELLNLQKKKLKEQKKKMSKIVDRRLKHLGKVIHHDPTVVESISGTTKTSADSGEVQGQQFSTEMPEADDAQSDIPSDDDSAQSDVEEDSSTRNAENFHNAIRGMLTSQARTKSANVSLKEETCEAIHADEDAMTSNKRAAKRALDSSTTISDIVRDNLQQDETEIVKRKSKKKKTTEMEMDLLDPEKRAETLALASAMLNPKHRESILEDSINRRTRGEEDLPDWFLQDEKKHYFSHKPITKEEVEFEKQRFKEINVRPSKKVAEAISRKRKRATRILRKVQQKGKTDPRMKEKGEKLSIRSLVRSKTLNKIHSKPMDNKMKGELYRGRQRRKKK